MRTRIFLGGCLLALLAAPGAPAAEIEEIQITARRGAESAVDVPIAPTVLGRDFGMAWGLGGWLLPPFLARIGADAAQRLRERVAAEITTTFASRYTREVSLAEALTLDAIGEYGRQATGAKYLVTPQR